MSAPAWFMFFVVAVCAIGFILATVDLVVGWVTNGADFVDWSQPAAWGEDR